MAEEGRGERREIWSTQAWATPKAKKELCFSGDVQKLENPYPTVIGRRQYPNHNSSWRTAIVILLILDNSNNNLKGRSNHNLFLFPSSYSCNCCNH